MKIIIDAYGGDNSPSAMIKGTIEALREEDFEAVIVGKEDEINSVLSSLEYDKSKVSVVNATEVIDCNEPPVEAIKKKADSSLVKAIKLLREDEDAKAFVSSGSTGAVLTAAVLLTKRIQGVNRPALSPILPNMKTVGTMLLDCGANVDCKPINLLQFAVMGSVYMREIMGVENPRVALLSNGTEDKKGCALTKEAFGLLKAEKSINFLGNMEARELLSGDYDVVVSDGFAGNVALKSVEGAAKCITGVLKREIKASPSAIFGSLFMKKAFKNLKSFLDYNKRGGAVLLGMQQVVVKAHGAANEESFKNAVLQAYRASKTDINDKIKEGLSLLNGENQ